MKIETKKIKELFNIEKGELQSTKNKSGDYDFITAAKEWKTHNRYSYDCEALVVAVAASGSLGRVHYVKGKFIASDLCFVLTPQEKYKDEINLDFYYSLLNALRDEIVALAKGAAKKSINKTNFGNFELPFISIDKQNLIAQKSLVVDDSIANLDSVYTDTLDSLSILRRLVMMSIENIKDYQEYTFSDLLSKNTNTIQVQDNDSYKRVTIKLYAKGIDIRDEIKGSNIGTKKQYVIKDGQFLISKIDARNAAFGLVPSECDGAITTSDFLSYDIDSKKVYPKFLFELLNTEKFNQLFNLSSQGATNRKRLKEDSFLSKKIELPNLEVQKQIIFKIELLKALEGKVLEMQTGTFALKQRYLFTLLRKMQPVTEELLESMPAVSPLQQAMSLVLRRFQRGEMVLAKVLYLAQAVYKVPLNVSFTQQAFGPYDAIIKKSVTDGLSDDKQFFVRKGTDGREVLALGKNSGYVINNIDETLKSSINAYLDDMMPHYFSMDSSSIELLASVAKIIEDENSADDTLVSQKLQTWKPSRFSDREVVRAIGFIKKNKWDEKLLTK